MESTGQPFVRALLLMEGGPLFNLQKRIGLIRGDPPRIKLRAVLAAVITFVPLLILAALQGRAIAHVEVPFVRDFSTYTRFLLAIPLLIFAENILGPRIAVVARHFVEAGLVREKDYASFDSFINRALRARDSRLAEVILLILSYVFAVVGLRSTAIQSSTWYMTRADSHNSLTWAGIWLICVSVPFFQFLVYRWLWRLFLWFQFLHRVRLLDLRLFPTHPDEAGGLGFVGETQRFFGIILFSLSPVTLVSWRTKSSMTRFRCSTSLLPSPLTSFFRADPHRSAHRFHRAAVAHQAHGLHQYGSLATAYTGAFQSKWIQHVNPEDEPLLGSADIQSLADLGNSYKLHWGYEATSHSISYAPSSHPCGPVFRPQPLLLAVMPLKELLRLLLKVLM